MFKSHSSSYPIEEGNIIRVFVDDERHNPKLGYVAPHKLYIWIQTHGKLEKDRPGKERTIHVTYFHVPNLPGETQNVMQISTTIRKVSLIQGYLRNKEHEVFGNVKWNHTRGSLRRAYRVLGLNYYIKR